MKYLDPKADLTFKRVFGEHPDLVISLLNALLPLKPEEEITSVEYLIPEMVPDNPLRKNTIVDVRCKDKAGRQFLVEMQMVWSPEFRQRVLLNATKAYARQINAGQHYSLLQPVYSLNLVNDVFEPDLKGFYHHYKIVHIEHSDRIIDGLQLIFVELPKFDAHTYSEKKMAVLWLRYLTEINEKTRYAPPELLANPQVNKALDRVEESAFSDAQLLGYELFWDIISRERGTQWRLEKVEKAEREALEKGLAKGLAEGEAKGLAKGEAKGLAEGVAKGEAKGIRLTATNFKKQGISPEIIAQCTGLSIDEINAL